MLEFNLFEKIEQCRSDFTKIELKIADYIEENPKKVLYMTITDLANACNVGDTSVFRLCKSLKLKGYQEFRMLLAGSLPIEKETEEENIYKETTGLQLLNGNIKALTATYNMIDNEKINKCVSKLGSARRICFFGVGSSLLTALDAKNKFMRIIPNVECSFDSHFQSMQASLLGEKDIAVMFSVSGSSRDIIDIAKLCTENKVFTVSIVCSKNSPLSKFSQIELVCPFKEGPFEGGSLSAKIAQLYMTDLIYNEYRLKNLETSIKNREKTSTSIMSKMY